MSGSESPFGWPRSRLFFAPSELAQSQTGNPQLTPWAVFSRRAAARARRFRLLAEGEIATSRKRVAHASFASSQEGFVPASALGCVCGVQGQACILAYKWSNRQNRKIPANGDGLDAWFHGNTAGTREFAFSWTNCQAKRRGESCVARSLVTRALLPKSSGGRYVYPCSRAQYRENAKSNLARWIRGVPCPTPE